MKPTTISVLALLQLSSAAVLPRQTTDDTCYFSLTARGTTNGTILEDGVGENRIGGTYPKTNFTIASHALSTASNQTCLIQPSNSQFECLSDAVSTTNFTIADDGSLLHDGCAEWWACEVDGPAEDGSWDIFGDGLTNTTGCESVTLITGGFSCAALGGSVTSSAAVLSSSSSIIPTSTAAGVTATSTPVSSATSTSTAVAAICPTSLTDASQGYISPSFILPISESAPNTTFAATDGAVSVSPGNSTLLNFAIPASDPYNSPDDNTCALIFLFPTKSSLANTSAPYFFSGTEEEQGENGGLDFTLLSETANAQTTWSTINSTSTSVLLDFGTVQVVPGNAYEVARFQCAGDRTFSVQVSSVGNVELDYVQDDAASAIGAFVVPCV